MSIRGDNGNETYWRGDFTEKYVKRKSQPTTASLNSGRSEGSSLLQQKKASITPSVTESNDSGGDSGASTSTSCPSTSNYQPLSQTSNGSVQITTSSIDNGVVIGNYLQVSDTMHTKDSPKDAQFLQDSPSSPQQETMPYHQDESPLPSPTKEELENALNTSKETDLRTRFAEEAFLENTVLEQYEPRRDSTKSAEPLLNNRTRYRRKGPKKPSIRYYSSSDLSSSKSLTKSNSSPSRLFGSRSICSSLKPFKSRNTSNDKNQIPSSENRGNKGNPKNKERSNRFSSINSILQNRR